MAPGRADASQCFTEYADDTTHRLKYTRGVTDKLGKTKAQQTSGQGRRMYLVHRAHHVFLTSSIQTNRWRRHCAPRSARPFSARIYRQEYRSTISYPHLCAPPSFRAKFCSFIRGGLHYHHSKPPPISKFECSDGAPGGDALRPPVEPVSPDSR